MKVAISFPGGGSAAAPAAVEAVAEAYAVQRAHHTGTQPLSTISDAGSAASHPATDFDAAGAAAVHAALTPGAHAAAAVSVTTAGLAVVTHANVQQALADLDAWTQTRPTQTSGLNSALPGNGTTPNGSLYFATDLNGGTLYEQLGGVQTVVAAGVTNPSGQMIAGPVQLSSTFDIKAVANTLTDVTNMSIAVPASSRPVVVRFKCEVSGNGGSATVGTGLSGWIIISDNANVNKAAGFATFTSTGASLAQNRDVVVELYLPAPVAAATYKVRAQTSAAIPANWTTLSIVPAGGLVSGATCDLVAIAL